ncbi:ATPase Cu transporting protein 7A [Actinomortierella ambigua]|uniref:P-type Cu(+) transporter n=1 Tax=Actinomortierella ambigua TaxID=1343610 RepID=A0A9P6QDQ0_9FUNG|nr:ATPase Cu transporting protein 7A [Actinomortierella ambigua]
MEIVTESKAAALSKATVGISGMTCASCVKAIEGSLAKLPSVQPGSVSVNLLVGSATLMASQELCTEDMIRQAIENSGYDVTSFKYASPLPSATKGSHPSATYKVSLNITGMFCASCTTKVENLFKTLPGVLPTTVKVSLATGSASFEYKLQNSQEPSFSSGSISEKIHELGFVADNVKVERSGEEPGASAIADDEEEASALTTTRLDISGMTCSSCVSAIEFQVNLLAKSGVIVHDVSIIGVRDLIQAVEDTGFEVSLAADDATTNRNALQEKIKKEELMLRKRMFWSLGFAVPMFIFSMVIMMMLPSSNPARMALMKSVAPGLRIYDIIMFILATPVQFWLAIPFYTKAYRALRYTHTANMETLVSLGTSVAYFASLGSIIAAMVVGREDHGGHGEPGAGVDFFETAVFLVFFINLGKWLEAMAKGKTAETITKLMDLQPDTATLVKPDETTEEIPASLVQVGDILLVNAGGRIPCDGLLWKGNTMVDEAMITGESMPVQKTERKSKVISASINLTAVIHVKATKVGKDTTLSRIIQLVQDAQASPKAPIEALGDKISSVFVPVVIVLGLLTFTSWMLAGRFESYPKEWLPDGVSYQIYATLFAVAVFVIACPCALGLASPAAVMVGTGVAAKHGILVKGGGFALEMAKRLDIVVFDKTGTLTTGKPVMTDSWILPSTDKSGHNMIFQILGKVEAGSSHPVALAVAKGAANALYNKGLPATKEVVADGEAEEEESENVQLQKQFNLVKVAHQREVAGRGLAATLSLSESLNLPGYGDFRAVNVIVGNEKWMQENGAHYPVQIHAADRQKELARWQSEGKSVVLLAISPAGGASLSGKTTMDASCQCELCACIECNCASSPLGQATVPLIVAQVSVADTARPESKDVVAGLRAMGIETWMLTGDHPTTAKAIAGQLGITNVIAGVLPEDKAAKVKQLQQAGRPLSSSRFGRFFSRQPEIAIDNRSLESSPSTLVDGSKNRAMRTAIVAMVGDGINDSPALAQSDLGISVGSATDIAIEAAQIVLLRDTLNDLLVMRDLAKTTVRRIQINFLWAFMYNVVMIPIAAGVLVAWSRSAVINPAWAGLAMAASSVSVVLSSLRLRSYKYKPPKH